MGKQWLTLFFWAPKSLQMVIAAMKLKDAQHSENEDHGIGLITSWQINGETVADFIFLSSKITADGDCSHEIKRFLLGRKVMTNLDGILKSRDISLSTNVPLFKAMVFPV